MTGVRATEPAIKVLVVDDQQLVRRGICLVLDTLEGLLGDGRQHVLSSGFSAVDVYLGSALGWGMFSGGIEARPAFARAFAAQLAAYNAQLSQE